MSRSLTARSAGALVVANMIGAGVFTTSGYALADHGRGTVLLAWVVGGVLATCGALSYGALGRRFPHSGGEYELLRRTVHPLAGFLAGWVSLLVGFTAPIAFAAAALERYVVPAFGVDLPRDVLGTVAILAAGGLHLAGVRVGSRVQDGVVGIKVLLIVALIVGGGVVIAGRGVPELVEPPPDFQLAPFAVTCVWVSFAYSGWNAASYVAGEIDGAERTLPRALLSGTLVTAGLYLGLNAVFVCSAPVADLAGRAEVALVAAESLGGRGVGRVVAGVVVLALFTSITAMTMAGPRVYARMAEDGLFPKGLTAGEDHRPAIVLQMVLALAMLWTSTFDSLMTFIGWTLSVSSAATVVGLFLLRRREGGVVVPVWGWPWVPAVFVVATFAIAGFSFASRPVEALWGVATVVAGILVYPLVRRLTARRQAE